MRVGSENNTFNQKSYTNTYIDMMHLPVHFALGFVAIFREIHICVCDKIQRLVSSRLHWDTQNQPPVGLLRHEAGLQLNRGRGKETKVDEKTLGSSRIWTIAKLWCVSSLVCWMSKKFCWCSCHSEGFFAGPKQSHLSLLSVNRHNQTQASSKILGRST